MLKRNTSSKGHGQLGSSVVLDLNNQLLFSISLKQMVKIPDVKKYINIFG